MNDERRELALKLRVGVFVLVALAVFLGMVYALGARARLFEARYTVHADFGEVGGLTEGATVRLAGVQSGRGTGGPLPGAPGGKVRVDLNIAKRFADRVRRDSIARVETPGVLGGKNGGETRGAAGGGRPRGGTPPRSWSRCARPSTASTARSSSTSSAASWTGSSAGRAGRTRCSTRSPWRCAGSTSSSRRRRRSSSGSRRGRGAPGRARRPRGRGRR